jgi:membrane protease YdiL (CAAX protease family)
VPRPEVAALLLVGLLFLPAIPAYLWMWPAVSGTRWLMPVQIGVYLYLLAGSLWIGLRVWDLDQLGINARGLGQSLAWGAVLVAGRSLVILGTSLSVGPRPWTFSEFVGDLLFYFGLVGPVEEFLFRGLIFRALEDWRGERTAVWGSAIAFGLYHVGVGGVLGFIAGLVSGIILGAIRLRAGGIVGPILVHGLIDVTAVEMAPAVTTWDFSHAGFPHPLVIVAGYLVIVGLLVFLWKLAPGTRRAGSA